MCREEPEQKIIALERKDYETEEKNKTLLKQEEKEVHVGDVEGKGRKVSGKVVVAVTRVWQLR